MPYASTSPWTITQFGNYVIPRVVYARFQDIYGGISSAVSDDISLDVTPPTGTVTIEPTAEAALAAVYAARGLPGAQNPATLPFHVFLPLVLDDYCFTAAGPTAVTLHLSASDDVSGVNRMKFSNEPTCACSNWMGFAASAPWLMSTGATVYVRFGDRAGNLSSSATSTLAPWDGVSECGVWGPRRELAVAAALSPSLGSFPPHGERGETRDAGKRRRVEIQLMVAGHSP